MDPRERFESMAASLEQTKERMEEATARLAASTFTAQSDDERITATVTSTGTLVALEIDPRVFRNPDSEALAASIVATVGEATNRAATGVSETMRELLGVDLGNLTDPVAAKDVGERVREQL